MRDKNGQQLWGNKIGKILVISQDQYFFRKVFLMSVPSRKHIDSYSKFLLQLTRSGIKIIKTTDTGVVKISTFYGINGVRSKHECQHLIA